MSAFIIQCCSGCNKVFPINELFVLKDYKDEDDKPTLAYICNNCDDMGPHSEEYTYKCFLCKCWMKENFFEHDDVLNACFECLRIKPNDKIWPVDGGKLLDSYNAALIYDAEISLDDHDWKDKFDALRKKAVIKFQNDRVIERQKRATRTADIADAFMTMSNLPPLDRSDAMTLASFIDIDRSPPPETYDDPYWFLDWVLSLVKKEG